jgi:AcrR family transcriptional regulator
MRKTLEDTEISRTKIIEAAEKEFSKHGYVGAKIENIAKATGMTKGAIFWHYHSKLGLFKEVIKKSTKHLRDSFDKSFASNEPIMQKCLKLILQVQREIPFELLLQISSMETMRSIPKDALSMAKNEIALIFHDGYKLLEQAKKRGELKPEANIMDILITLLLFMSGFSQISNSKEMLSIKEDIDSEAATKILFKGLDFYQK